MAIFHSDQQIYRVLQDVFQHITNNPKNIEAFTRSNLVVRLRTNSPEAEVLLDGRQPPLEIFYGATPGIANLEITLTADLMHRMWMGHESSTSAFFSGKIKTKGNILKAAQLLDLFREVERIYPTVAEQYGLK